MNLDSALRNIFVVMMVLAALLPFVPDPLSPLSVSFSISFGLFVFLGMGKAALSHRFEVGTPEIALFFFSLSILLSGPVALANNVSFSAWLRGLIPFLFLSVYFAIAPIRTEKDARFVLNTLHLAAVVWLVKIMVIVFFHIDQIFSGIGRLTYLTMDLTLPYTLVGLVLSLFNPEPRAVKWRGILTIAFLLIILGTGYRSQILLALAILFVYLYKQSLPKRIILVLVLSLTGALLLLIMGETPFWQELILRFQNISLEGELSRTVEIEYALQQFAHSPILGNGLGYPIPVVIIFAGDWENVVQLLDVTTVGFIHNLWAYLLMDLGIVGFCAYLWFVGGALWKGWRDRKGGTCLAQVKFNAAISLIAILLFFTVEASFRLIQSNIITAVLVALLVCRSNSSRQKAMDS